MITCANCNEEVNESSKFCTACGSAMNQQSSHPNAKNANPRPSQIKITTPNETSIDIDFSNIKNKVDNYWQYLIQTATQPSLSFNQTNIFLGWLQIAVLSLLTSTIVATFLNEAYVKLGFINFLKLFSIQVVAILCPILVSFLIVRFLKKNPLTFGQVSVQLGGLLSMNVFILALVLIFSLLSPIGLIDIISLLIGLSGIINITAFNIYLYHTENKGKIDSFIATILGNILYILLVTIIARIFLGVFLEGLSSTSLWEELIYDFMGDYFY